MTTRIPILILFILMLCSPGCRDEANPVAPACPGPRVAGLTPVETLGISDDPFQHATVTISWSSPLPNAHELGVDGFEIRTQPAGKEITENNWCGQPLLGTYPAGDKIGFFARFDHEHEAITPGATQSFAVRPRYENGDLGPVGTVLTHRLTGPFTVQGLVRDDTGAPLSGITVRLVEPHSLPPDEGITFSTVTGPDGRFSPLGPISDQAAMVVATDSPDTLTVPDAEDSYFDFTTEPLNAGPENEDITITLVTRYAFEYQPDGWVATYFITWLQSMVNASHVGTGYRLRRWESYDLKVFVPEGMNNTGTIDLAAVTREVLEEWNDQLGLVVFTETDDPALAQVEVAYEEMEGLYGVVLLDKPEGYHFNGEVIPERAIVKLNPVMNYLEGTKGVVMHEFGHVLGIIKHSTAAEHLMNSGSTCCLSRDELRLITAIMHLPQNCLLSNFEEGIPWPWP